MERNFESSITVLSNIGAQFSVENLVEKEWTKEDHSKFWLDFENIITALKHEVNKLALLVDINDKKNKASDQDIQTLSKSVEQICVTLWSTYLRLSPNAGRTFCTSISKTCITIVKSTLELLVSLSKCAKRQQALQKVGEIWEKYDLIKTKALKDNIQAVCAQIQDQRNLVQDALDELEESKEETEDLDLLAPAMGLIKTSLAITKKIQSSIKQNGDNFNQKSVQDMDKILEHCQKLSPLVDDLAMPLYPPMCADEIEVQSKILTQCLEELIRSLKSVHFVSAKEYDEWCSFLLKAVNHNSSKLDVALTASKLEQMK